MGIPFSLAFTMIAAHLMGYTVNNITLAAIIIVLGIVVDDAIIVAENITRQRKLEKTVGSVESTLQVFHPVIASALTTCAAFVPLYFFSGRFGLVLKYLPAIIFLMLAASIMESFLILPAHMSKPLFFEKYFTKNSFFQNLAQIKNKRIAALENYYRNLINALLKKRVWVFITFIVLLGSTLFLFKNNLRYVMFPREESKDFRVKVKAPEGTQRDEMAQKIRQVEDVFMKHEHVVGVLSRVGQSRRGGETKTNEASIRVEVVPPTERKESLNKLFAHWKKETDNLEGFEEIKLLKSRWGHDSGSPIEIEIQENDDRKRDEIVKRLQSAMNANSALSNVEIERPVNKQEFRLKIRREETSRLGVNYEQLSSVLRSYIEGDVLYTLNSGEEEIDVRFTSASASKDDINDVLALTVANKDGYLVPIKQLINVQPGKRPANIQRVNFKRSTKIHADLNPKSSKTPLEIANEMEAKDFQIAITGFPSANIIFRGEVEESRSSQGEFQLSILLVLAIIYILLVFLFNSPWTPLLIAAIIPFGIMGSIFAFWSHGFNQYGFFAVVGALGMVGVVVNDSIVLVDKLQEEIKSSGISFNETLKKIATISSTRLRAVVVTTLTTVAGIFPTAYGLAGYDSMLAE